jgi:ubiquinone/menaquinone biosynthesis C-methylase UbiE
MPALKRDIYQIPHSQAREGYAPGRDLAYWMSGYAHYKVLETAAHKYGVSGGRYFDFGGSSGRVFRHFGIQSDAWDVWTCDFNPASIEFVNAYFPSKIKAFLNNASPSLPLPDGYFDLITALSVFTHIDEAESSWLLELRRVLRIGGIACITTLNDATWPVMDEVLRGTITTYRPDLADTTSLPDGKTVIPFREDDPYNCNVLHSDSYVRSRWGRFFEICEIRPLTFNSQALVVCRRTD